MTTACVPVNRRVLIIDDNPAIHADFRKILSARTKEDDLAQATANLFGPDEGAEERPVFELSSAYQGQEGLEAAQQARTLGQPFALAFVDVRMPPGMDGIETTARLLEADPHLQIVICTAYSDHSWGEITQRLGATDRMVILKKPFDVIEILQLANALTEKWRLARQAERQVQDLDGIVQQRTQELRVANEKLVQDMAARKKAEEALRQSQKMEAFGQLAAGVAHDFNNILTVILGHAALLQEENVPEEARLAAATEIRTSSERAANLTRQLLTFSQRQVFQPKNLDLNEVVANMTKMLLRLIGEHIHLEARYAGTEAWLNADQGMMEQILMNLAVNSRDAMPLGGRLILETSFAAFSAADLADIPGRRPGEFVHLAVCDTGSGIAPEHLPHVFEPFFTTKEPGKGTGLGLATVFGIVEKHRGWIEIESNVNVGTTFHIYLPRLIQSTPAADALRGSAPPARGRETLLLVEDEEPLRMLTRRVLEKHGYRVFEAESGTAALEVWQNHIAEIDMLITDMVMPGGIGGRELADLMRHGKPALKVIYCSGYTDDMLGASSLLRVNGNFLEKPFTPDKLLRRVRAHFDA